MAYASGKWLALLALALCTFALAQEAAPPARTSLHDCIIAALQGQSDVQTGKLDVISATARLTQTHSTYYPKVSVQTSKSLLDPGNGAQTSDLSTALTVKQTFVDGGLRDAAMARAKLQVQQANSALQRSQQTVIYSVTRAYLAVLRAEALEDVAASQVGYIEGQLDMIRARIAAGDAAEVESLPVQAQLANARVSELATKNSVRTATVQLQQAMGSTPTGTLALEPVRMPDKLLAESSDKYLALALAQREELLQQSLNVGMAKTGVATAAINAKPRPSVSGELAQPIGGSTSRTYTISAAISYDLFDAESNKAVLREAKTALAAAEVRAAQSPKDIAAEVQTAALTLDDARSRIEASQLSIEAAQRNLEAQTGRYQQGLAIALDLVNGQLAVTNARNIAVQARYDYLTALAQLHYATGAEGEVTWE